MLNFDAFTRDELIAEIRALNLHYEERVAVLTADREEELDEKEKQLDDLEKRLKKSLAAVADNLDLDILTEAARALRACKARGEGISGLFRCSSPSTQMVEYYKEQLEDEVKKLKERLKKLDEQ